jgi:hypothetical protein
MKPLTFVLALFTLGLTTITPAARADVSAWPLLVLSEEETNILYPLYVDEPRFKMIFPLYYRTNQQRDTHLLWPLVKFHDGQLVRAAPFYFRDNEDYIFFPFIWQSEDFALWFVPPMYFDKVGDFSAIVPVYIRNRDSMFLFPNTYWHRNSDNDIDHWCFWPFITSDKRDSDYFRFLTYFRRSSGTRTTAAMFPIYCHSKTASSESTWFLPYYREKTETSDTRVFFPLFGATDEQTIGGGDRRKRDYLWPFYRIDETRNVEGEVTHRKRRFLIFSDTRSGGRRTLSVFGIPVSERIE